MHPQCIQDKRLAPAARRQLMGRLVLLWGGMSFTRKQRTQQPMPEPEAALARMKRGGGSAQDATEDSQMPAMRHSGLDQLRRRTARIG